MRKLIEEPEQKAYWEQLITLAENNQLPDSRYPVFSMSNEEVINYAKKMVERCEELSR